jgi:hypothetical protein
MLNSASRAEKKPKSIMNQKMSEAFLNSFQNDDVPLRSKNEVTQIQEKRGSMNELLKVEK